MGALGKKLRTLEGGIISFQCPGCDELHGIPVTGDHPVWGWNGSIESPTFTPSIRVSGVQHLTDAECQRVLNGEKIVPIPSCCHSFIADGKIQFLSDCTHKLAGQTVELPDWDG